MKIDRLLGTSIGFFVLGMLALTILALMSGCSTLSQLPPNSCESASFKLTVGPFFEQDATLAGVTKTTTGLKIGNFVGSTSYLGIVNFSQQFHDLIVDQAGAPAK